MSKNLPRGKQARSLKTGFDFRILSIGKILDLCKLGEISPIDVARICAGRVKKLENKYHAWVFFDQEKLLQDAKKIELSIKRDGLLELSGIPVGVKDIFNTVDFPTEMGSPIWKNFTPGNDARVVYYLRHAGAIIPGKTVTAEFAVHTPGETLNPHDITRTCGTSSSGSAVAIALGMVPASFGTQTAGSIIRPASYCGVWGFKPSFGFIPRTGILKTTDSLDSVGFFTSQLGDARRIFDVIRVKGQNYPISNATINDLSRQHKAKNLPWRVALVKTHLWKNVQSYARDSLVGWAKKLVGLRDIHLEEVELPMIMNNSHQVHSTIYDKSLSYYFGDEYKKASLVSPILNGLIKHGLGLSMNEYLDALEMQIRMVHVMDRFFKNWDILISVSTSGVAPLLTEEESADPCLVWTLAQLPVVGAPVFSHNALPFGAQIVARKYNDLLLLDFVHYLRNINMVPLGPNPLLKL